MGVYVPERISDLAKEAEIQIVGGEHSGMRLKVIQVMVIPKFNESFVVTGERTSDGAWFVERVKREGA